MRDKIEKLIRFYVYGLEIKNIKVVMTSNTYYSLLGECDDEIIINNSGYTTFLGHRVEIYDKIDTDFYVCEII